MKIGYVVKRFPRASETFIAQEILELERQGEEVHVFALGPNDNPAPHSWLSEISASVTHCDHLPLSNAWKWLHRRSVDTPDRKCELERVLQLAFRYPTRQGRLRLTEGVAVSQAAEAAGVDHLHAHFANEPTFVTLLAHTITGIPFSYTAHAKDIYAKGPAPEILEQQVDRASFVVTVTEDNVRALRDRLGDELGGKVLRLYNGVDLGSIQPNGYGAGGDRPRIVCVARLVEKKGVDNLLESVATLRARGVEADCRILGDGPERDRLEALAADLGISGSVAFLGTTAHEDVIEEMRHADVVALPARVASNGDKDALPTVLLEAMACGVPVVSTTVGGIPEIVQHGATGLLVTPDSSWALSSALGELLSDLPRRKTMGIAGRARAEKLFDLGRNVGRLRQWFEASALLSDKPVVKESARNLRLVSS